MDGLRYYGDRRGNKSDPSVPLGTSSGRERARSKPDVFAILLSIEDDMRTIGGMHLARSNLRRKIRHLSGWKMMFRDSVTFPGMAEWLHIYAPFCGHIAVPLDTSCLSILFREEVQRPLRCNRRGQIMADD